MRKIIAAVFFVVFSGYAFAGDISDTVFVDTAIGLTSGAAIGALTALAPYSNGKNPAVFGAGTGLGAMIGGFCGLTAGIWHASYRASNVKRKVSYGNEFEITPAHAGLIIKTNF